MVETKRTVYRQLKEQFKLLENLNPDDEMVKYHEYIGSNAVDSQVWQISEVYEGFRRLFCNPSLTDHEYLLGKCLGAVNERINELQKKGELEKLTSESA